MQHAILVVPRALMEPAEGTMNRLSPQNRLSWKELGERLDRVAGHMNVLLVVIALGLATLDFTFFVTEKVVDSLPPITVSNDGPPAAPAR
jgi:hypothetical protein